MQQMKLISSTAPTRSFVTRICISSASFTMPTATTKTTPLQWGMLWVGFIHSCLLVLQASIWQAVHGWKDFGLKLYGDAAKVKRNPLENILLLVYMSMLLSWTFDCTEHKHEGGKGFKKLHHTNLPIMHALDQTKEFSDLILCDGAGNCQKNGDLLMK